MVSQGVVWASYTDVVLTGSEASCIGGENMISHLAGDITYLRLK
jgi:hypothetical protein